MKIHLLSGFLGSGKTTAIQSACRILQERGIKAAVITNDQGIRLVCISAGSPYYNPHIQRPALFPPSDGYEPPEDPLAGVARQIDVTSRLTGTEGRKAFASGEIRAGGSLVAEATGIYVTERASGQ